MQDDDVVIIGGSLHEQEDEALLDAYEAARAASDRAALIVVPRYPADAAAFEQHARARGHRAVRKTAVAAGAESAPGRSGVLVVDTVGELGKLYAAADIAFVGGSLFFRGANKGGHNLMEPAILAVPVLFGPYNFSFKETVEDLLAANAGRLVADANELATRIVELVARRDGAARARIARTTRRACGSRCDCHATTICCASSCARRRSPCGISCSPQNAAIAQGLGFHPMSSPSSSPPAENTSRRNTYWSATSIAAPISCS